MDNNTRRRFADVLAGYRAANAEGETVKVLTEFLWNSNLLDLAIPVLKGYLLDGRNARNATHVRKSAEDVTKKIVPWLEQLSIKVGGCHKNVNMSATFTHILMDSLPRLITKLADEWLSSSEFKSALHQLWEKVQLQLVQVFHYCYPKRTTNSVGQQFINYVMEHVLGGVSPDYINQIRQQLLGLLTALESKFDATAPPPSFIVFNTAKTTTKIASTEAPPQKTLSRRDLLLGTQGTCFICLRLPPRRTPGKEVCLRNLSRYLDIKSQDMLRHALGLQMEDNISSSSTPPSSNFWVTMCPRCVRVVGELCRLVKQQEMATMLVHHKVQVLYETLEQNAGGETCSSNPVEAKLVAMVRKETEKRCRKKIAELRRNSIPKVRLEKYEPPKPAEEALPASLTPPPTTPSPQPPSPPPPSPASPPPPTPPIPSPDSSTPADGNLMEAPIQRVPPLRIKIPPECKKIISCWCSFCKRSFASTNQFREHSLSLHPEQLYASSKLPALSLDSFRGLCQQLLRTLAKNKKNRGSKQRSQCSLCSKTFSRPFNLRRHLVVKHDRVMKSKLLHLQQIWVQQNLVPEEGEQETNELLCDFVQGGCGRSFTELSLLNKHQRAAVCGGRQLPCGFPGCALVLKSRCALLRHRKEKSHRRFKRQEQERPHCKPQEGGCGLTFSRIEHLRRHQRESCPFKTASRARLQKKRVTPPQTWTCNLKKEGCGITFSTKRYLRRHRRKSCASKKVQPFSPAPWRSKASVPETFTCSFDEGGCGQVFAQMDRLLKHQMLANQRSRSWTCYQNNCLHRFWSTCALARHRKEAGHQDDKAQSIHSIIDPWVCKVEEGGCGRTFVTSENLRRHKSRVCPQRQDAQSKTPEQQSRAHRLYESLWLWRTCYACGGRKFRNRQELAKHKSECHGERPLDTEIVPMEEDLLMPLYENEDDVQSMHLTIGIPNEESPRLDLNTDAEVYPPESVTCWCGQPSSFQPMIQCDLCFVWYHRLCEGLVDNRVPELFFCSKCSRSAPPESV